MLAAQAAAEVPGAKAQKELELATRVAGEKHRAARSVLRSRSLLSWASGCVMGRGPSKA